MKIPKHFPNWDTTIDGLQDAGLWALDHERSRLPADLVMPQAGQIWETLRECEVNFRALVDWPQPQPALGWFPHQRPGPPDLQFAKSYMMQFVTGQIRRGERVRILEVGEAKPIHINFVPLRYDELHEHIVPLEVRKFSGYHGYTLSVKTARTVSDFQNARPTYFTEDFRLVENLP